MAKNIQRKSFLRTAMLSPLLLTGFRGSSTQTRLTKQPGSEKRSRLKISLNAYSFNEPLRNGSMTLFDLLDFCAEQDFDAVDLTGYYFPGYPNTPSDDFIFSLKRKAHLLGLDISGTGVRNDFANPDKEKRNQDIELIKSWIDCASKLSAPVIRIFSGNAIPVGFSWQQVADWMVSDIKECVAYGKQHGVLVAMQNHNDFIKTADEAEKILKMVNSDWFGLVLDIGSYRNDPYKEIAQTAAYAVNWQLKENLYINGVEQKTDLDKIIPIIKSSGYRGYLPIETLGPGDPKLKVPAFLTEVRNALAKNA